MWKAYICKEGWTNASPKEKVKSIDRLVSAYYFHSVFIIFFFSDKGIEMTSLLRKEKQIPLNLGYYINVGDIRTTLYQNNNTDAAPLISANVYARSTTTSNLSTLFATAGSAVLKDMGKTLMSSGRVFRKVQLVTSTNSLVNGGTEGVGGVDSAPTNYLTGYIELPGTHGDSSGSGSYTAVARLG
jgi:hypothetical protein